MKQHEREYFTARVRSGIHKVNFNDTKLRVLPVTLDQNLEIQEEYLKSYRESEEAGFLTQDEMLESMRDRGLWSDENDQKITGLEKDLDRLKVELFQNRNKSDVVRQIRLYLTAGRSQLNELLNTKNQNYEHTCEGIATKNKVSKLMNISCFKQEDDDWVKYKFDNPDVPMEFIMKLYGMQVLSESSVRELARSEPWRSTWILKESNSFDLFNDRENQLTSDQRGLLIWSKMYDNVYESMDCPSDSVVDDDDMLDGWMIIQKRKRDKERAEKEIEQSTTNSKISNSDEIFVMAHDREDADKINQSNTFHAQKVKEQRSKLIKQRGSAVDLDFQDQQLRMRQQTNEAYKGKFGR
jgi:hypothetical protein